MPRFRRNLWLLFGNSLAGFLGISVQSLALNLYLVSLGYREDFVGFVGFVQTAAIGIGALPASWLTPRLGARRILIVSTLVLGISFGAMGMVESPILLLAMGAVSGVAMAHFFVPSAPYLMDNAAPDQRRSVFAIAFAVLSVSSVLGSAIGGVVPGLFPGPEIVGLRAALVFGSILTALGAIFMLLANDDKVASSSLPASATAVAPSPATEKRDLFAMALTTIFLAAATGLVVQFLNVYLRDVVQVKTDAIGTIYAVAAIAMAPTSLVAPRLAARFGLVNVIVWTRLLSVPFIILLIAFPASLWLSASMHIVRTATVGLSQPLDNAFSMELVSPRLRAQVAAIRTMSWNGGWAVATGAGGIAIVAFGYAAIFIAAAILTCASCGVMWIAFRNRQVG
jgi:predicted MFS family arabinose efflux permease